MQFYLFSRIYVILFVKKSVHLLRFLLFSNASLQNRLFLYPSFRFSYTATSSNRLEVRKLAMCLSLFNSAIEKGFRFYVKLGKSPTFIFSVFPGEKQ